MATVFQDVFSAIPFGKTEVENFFSVQETDTAGFGAEAVDEPREFCERAHLQDSSAGHVALGPGGADAGVGA